MHLNIQNPTVQMVLGGQGINSCHSSGIIVCGSTAWALLESGTGPRYIKPLVSLRSM